jgi:hypothetical protein
MHGKPQHSFHQAVNIPDVIVYPRWIKLWTFGWSFWFIIYLFIVPKCYSDLV